MINITPIFPSGTNSTMFTECCETAICDDERCCPSCGLEVIGADAQSEHERGKVRWFSATRFWNRSKS